MRATSIYCASGIVFILSALYIYHCFPDWKLICTVILTALFFAVFVVSRIIRKSKTRSAMTAVAWIAAASVLGAAFSLCAYKFAEQSVTEAIGETHILELRIAEIDSREHYSTIVAKIISIDGEKIRSAKCLIQSYGYIDARIGDELRFEGSVKPLSESSKNYYRTKGIYARTTPADTAEIELTTRGYSLLRTLNRIKTWATAIFERYVYTSDGAAFASALFLGDRDDISPRTNQAFLRTGTSHLLAVSGLHLVVLAGGLFALLEAFTLDRRISCVIIIASSIFYVALTGFAASAIRAAVMLTIYYTAILIGRQSSALPSLVTTGVLMCAFSPYTAADVGFQLSFLSTAGIIASAPTIKSALSRVKGNGFISKLIKGLLSSIFMTCAATLFTLPVIAVTFKGISVVSPLANLLLSPPIELILVLLPILLLLSPIPFLANGLGFVIVKIYDASVYLLSALARLEWAYVSAYRNIVYIILFALMCIIIASLLKRSRRSRYICLAAAIAAAGTFTANAVYMSRNSGKAVYTYAVDNREQTLFFHTNNYRQTVIADTSAGKVSHGVYIRELLDSAGVMAVERFIVTDYNSEQLAMLDYLLRHIAIKTLVLPQHSRSNAYLSSTEKIRKLAESAGCEIIYETTYTADDLSLTIAHAQNKKGRQVSIEFAIAEYTGVYLTQGEYAIYNTYLNPKYDVIIIGSHGARPLKADLGELKTVPKELYITSYLKNISQFKRPYYFPENAADIPVLTLFYDEVYTREIKAK